MGHEPPPLKPPKPKLNHLTTLKSTKPRNDSPYRLDTISEERHDDTIKEQSDDSTVSATEHEDLSHHVKLSEAPLTDLADWVFDKHSGTISDNIINPHAPDPPFEYVNVIIEDKAEDDTPIYMDPPDCVLRKMHPAHVILKDQLQGDTGANCGATNDATILWHYKRLIQPIPITTYSDDQEETSCVAIGTGIVKIIANDNTTTNWLMLHTPKSTGTILSPDRYMMDNPEVQSFHHQGDRNNTGTISF